MSEPITPERARALLAPLDEAERAHKEARGTRAQFLASMAARRAFEPLAMEADHIARAYLAEHERAERAEKERDALIGHGCDGSEINAVALLDLYHERAQRAEAEAARLREVVDAARATSRALKRYAVHVSAGLADAWVDLDDALARLDGPAPSGIEVHDDDGEVG